MTHAQRSATDCPAWQELKGLALRLRDTSTRELFAGNPRRFEHFRRKRRG